MNEDRIYIGEAAFLLDRRIGTIRKWEREGLLPDEFKPERDDRGWRYWSQDQIDGIREWMKEIDLRPGKGLPYNQKTTEEQVRQHLRNLRRPRGRRIVKEQGE